MCYANSVLPACTAVVQCPPHSFADLANCYSFPGFHRQARVPRKSAESPAILLDCQVRGCMCLRAAAWRGGSVVRRMNEATLRRARLVLEWVTVFGRVYVTKPTRSTQPCFAPGSLNPVLVLIGWSKGGNVTSGWWQLTLCDPIWHVSFRSELRIAIRVYTSTYVIAQCRLSVCLFPLLFFEPTDRRT